MKRASAMKLAGISEATLFSELRLATLITIVVFMLFIV
jgi:hypothetical protein